LTKNVEFSNTVGSFPISYGDEWDTCTFGVFPAGFSGEKITFDATLRLIMPKDTVACNGNRGEGRQRN